MTIRSLLCTILLSAFFARPASAGQSDRLGENAALRYWSAFAEMNDEAITPQQVKELSAILEGTTAYDDLKYKRLVEGNRHALETMARGTSLSACDWGVDYALGPEAPMDYPGKAVALARLNVLFAFHLQKIGDEDGSVRALAAGLRFSHDIANGGTLLAALLAKDSLVKHLGAIAFLLHAGALSPAQRSTLRAAITQLGLDPLDWNSAMRLELQALGGNGWPSSLSLNRFTQLYLAAIDDPSTLPKLQRAIALLPPQIQQIVPNPKRVIENKQDLVQKLREMRYTLK